MSDRTTGRIRYAGDLTIRDKESYCVASVGASPRSTKTHHANARRLVACWNACEGIPTDFLQRPDLWEMGMLRQAQAYDELLAALDQMTAWARHVTAHGGRALVLGEHIKAAETLLAKHQKRATSHQPPL